MTRIDGEQVVSTGLEPTCRTVIPGPNPEITLRYQFKRPRLPGRRWTLVIHTDPPAMTVPGMALVSHPRTVPLSIDDGEIVARFPEGRDAQEFPIPANPQILKRSRLRLFPDPHSTTATSPPIRVRHPDAEGTRV
jgi:hypothetical protein